jgi:PAS domain S-box-containing protein
MRKKSQCSEDKFRSLFEKVPVGVFQSTPEGKILTANPALLHMLRYDSFKEFLKANITRDLYVNPEDRYLLMNDLETKNEVQNIELNLKRKNGQQITVLENSHAVRDSVGKVLYYEGILTDITERKRVDDKLKKYKEKLEELVKKRTNHLTLINGQLEKEIAEKIRIEDELKQVADELKRSNAELQQFAYVASHDLQEPLRMISSFTQLLQKRYKGKLDPDADDFIEFVVGGALQMKMLIDNLLSYSRVSSHRRDFEMTDCNLIVDNALKNLKAVIQESGATITRDHLPTVLVDRLQIYQVFQNLISNAIKFRTESSPVIHISAEQKGQDWIFSVSDNGIGISSEFFKRIFLIFQRLHSRNEYPGTGIGLAICKKIVERHGGRIWVESECGKGSVFYFSIPAKGHK